MNNQDGSTQVTKGKRLRVVTFFGGTNYGTNFQAFALIKVLQDYGYDASVITGFPNPNDGRLKKAVKAMLLSVGLLQIKYKLLELRRLRELKQRKIHAFSKENYKIEKAYTKRKLKRIVEETDVFVSGSDQIWNPYFTFAGSFYFLDFAQNKKRISYASSIGVSSIPDERKTQMRDLLMRYEHIGVREETAVKVLSELTGRDDIVQVLDPTFLLTKEDWLEAAKDAQLEFEPPERFIFALILGNNPWYNEQMKDVAARAGLHNIILLRSNESEEADFCIEGARVYKNAGPKEFLQLLERSSLVVTDSFHGTALSINFKKPFVEFVRFNDANPNSPNSRVYDVLTHYGLMGQIYNKESDEWLGLYNEALHSAGGGAIHKSRSPFASRQRALAQVFSRGNRGVVGRRQSTDDSVRVGQVAFLGFAVSSCPTLAA